MRRYVTGNKVIEKRGRGLKIIGWDSRQKKADAATPPAHQTSHASNAASPKTARFQFFIFLAFLQEFRGDLEYPEQSFEPYVCHLGPFSMPLLSLPKINLNRRRQ